MKSAEIRERFLKFFEKRGHVVMPSASLIPSDENGVTDSTLFNTAGMQPLIPYILGKPHPDGKRLVDVQKCLRTVDIDEIGDNVHATFFEMLGNWSLGDYFKKEAIQWSFDFLTSKEEGLGLDPNGLYVTVFEGDDNAPKDEEAENIWRDIFHKNKIDAGDAQKGRIFFMPASANWWQAGDNGPCGPDTEMFFDANNVFGGKTITKEQFAKADADRDIVEVWNDVFMQYEKKEGKIVGKLSKPSVDTGAGLERLTMVMQGVNNIYDTDILIDIFEQAKKLAEDTISQRIVTDHIRAGVFLIADGVIPSNTDRGYILRRLLRRAIFKTKEKRLSIEQINTLVEAIISSYKGLYRNIEEQKQIIIKEIKSESDRFSETLNQGLKKFDKGIDPFVLFSTYGFPFELTLELAKEKGIFVDTKNFEEQFEKHKVLSRVGAEKKFKGGLSDTSDMSVRYHTATHLLHQALHDVLGDKVKQQGSNITPERLRFDFSFERKMTDEEKKRVQDIVNQKIKECLPVNVVVMPFDEAEKTGARHFFGDKYGDDVSIYFIGRDIESAYSKEFCGGPHVKNTSELGKFEIRKEEAVSQGTRRIRAVLV